MLVQPLDHWARRRGIAGFLRAIVAAAIVVWASSGRSEDWLDELAAGRDEEAAALLEQALEETPERAELWRELGWLYWRLGRRGDAEELWSRWRSLDEDNPEPHDLLARVYLAEDRFDEAIASLRRVLELAPDRPDVPFILARALRWAGHLPEAVERLRRLHAQDPDNREIRAELALALSDLWEYEQALRHWAALREADPDNLDYIIEEARAALHTGAVRSAVRTARDVLRRDPRNRRALAILADAAEFGGRPAEARDWVARWLETTQDPEERRTLLSRLIRLEERLYRSDPRRYPLTRSIDLLRRILEEDPEALEVRLRLAELLVRAGHWDEAEMRMVEVLREWNPNSRRAHLALFEIALARRDFRTAERQLAILRGFHPEDPYLAWHLARLLHARGRSAEALRMLDRLVRAGERGAVAVLLYHALTGRDYGPALPVRELREHLRALLRSGYRVLTPCELRTWWERHGPAAGLLPDGRLRRAAIITFDDALETSFRFATPIALGHGVQFTMFVPVGHVERKAPYVVDWNELRRLAASGAWVFGSHLQNASEEVPVDRAGRRWAYPVAVRQWLPGEDRSESEEEYLGRLRMEYATSREVLERELGTRVDVLAYPYGEIGQEYVSNVPDAPALNLSLARRHYRIGFIQDPVAHATRDADPLLYPRHEFPVGTTGEEAVQYLLDHHPCIFAELARLDIVADHSRAVHARRIVTRLRDYGYPDEALQRVEKGLRGRMARAFVVPDVQRSFSEAPARPLGARVGVNAGHYRNNLDTRRTTVRVVGEKIAGDAFLLTTRAGGGPAWQRRPGEAPPGRTPRVSLDEREATFTLSWVGRDRTSVVAEAGVYMAEGDADRVLWLTAAEIGGRPVAELDLRVRVERAAPEDPIAVANGLSFVQGRIDAVWNLFADVDLIAATEVRRYSDGNRRTAIGVTPVYRPLEWNGWYTGARYSRISSERNAEGYWTPETLDAIYAIAGFRGLWANGFAGVEARLGMARETTFPAPGAPDVRSSWDLTHGVDAYWGSATRRRRDLRLEFGHAQTPEYQQWRADASVRWRF